MADPAILTAALRKCPGTFNCSGSLTSFDIGRVPTYFSIVSCSLSCLGSILILTVYFGVRGIRNGTQKIITLLAIADFFTASGYLIAAGNFLQHYEEKDLKKCDTFMTVCQIQSCITTWSSLCSFSWTVALAFHFLLMSMPNKKQFAAKLLPFENVVAWLIPIAIVLPLLVTGKLGFTPYAASNWCYIKENNYKKDIKDSEETIALILVAGKFWEILSYVIVVVLYAVTRWRFHKQKTYLKTKQRTINVDQVEQRLLMIPIMFLVLRIWGTVQFFFSLAVSSENQNGCIPQHIQKTFYAFGILQAVGDGGQGWGNALLYIFLSPTLRTRVFTEPLQTLFHHLGKGLKRLADRMIKVTDDESDSDTNPNENSLLQQPVNTANSAKRQQVRRASSVASRVTYSDFDSVAPTVHLDSAAPGPSEFGESFEVRVDIIGSSSYGEK